MTSKEEQRAARIQLSLRGLAVLFVFGAVVLTIFDGFHTYSGTTLYPTVFAWRAAWWTPLNFGIALSAGGTVFALVYELLGGKKAPPSWSRLAPGFVAFGALYYFSGFFHGANEIKLAVLSTSAVLLWLALDGTRAGAACALVTAFTGPLVEVVLVNAGAFKHLQPDLAGVPMWLPALYACSGPVVGQGARRWLGAK